MLAWVKAVLHKGFSNVKSLENCCEPYVKENISTIIYHPFETGSNLGVRFPLVLKLMAVNKHFTVVLMIV